MATVTTHLQMLSKAEHIPRGASASQLVVTECAPKSYLISKQFYYDVGENYAWNDKRNWSDDQWKSYSLRPNLKTFIACLDESPVGYFELEKCEENGVELAYFGLLQAYIGQGLGGVLLNHAIARAWDWNTHRVWVHTCTLDHQNALRNYLKSGFKPYEPEHS